MQGRMLTMKSGVMMPDGIRGARRFDFAEDEEIADIAGTASTSITSFAINPGQVGTFPFLATIAQRFEKYVFTQLEFYYKREVSEFATAGQTGKVVLSADYDASDAPPTSKQQMMDTDPHVDGMPCENMVLVVDCREAFDNGPKYVRPGGLPGAADIKTYDIGNLNVGVFGSAGDINVGELHVRYAGYFEKAVLESTTAVPANNSVSLFSDSVATTCTTTVAKTLPLATTVTNGLGIVNTSGSMVPLAGNYLVDVTGIVTDSAAEAFSAFCDFKKNAVSLNAVAAPEFSTGVSLGAAAVATVTQPYFVTANGTDAFTVVATMTGAVGTLSTIGKIRWIAI